MKKSFRLALISMIILWSFAFGKNIGWQEVQVMSWLNKEIQLTNNLGLRGSFIYLYGMGTREELSFTYIGPYFYVGKQFFVAPQIGVIEYWTGDGSNALIASLWGKLSLKQEKIILFGHIDKFFSRYEKGSYGFYTIDYYINKQKNIGINIEQWDKSTLLGPHIGYTVSYIHAELQYYIGLKNKNYGRNVRFLIRLNF